MDMPTGSGGRVVAFGNQLVEVHIWLREQLARLRAEVDAFHDGRAARPRQLHAHCLAFCTALSRHHSGEDGAAFPALAKQFPDLGSVLDELARDHQVVSGVLHDLDELLNGLAADPNRVEARRVRAELDGLSALLESHFTYEEKRLISALNSLNIPTWTRTTPDFLLTNDNAMHAPPQ